MSYVHAAEIAQEMRSPDTVMRLARLGSAFPTRLSFGRALIRRLIADGSTVRRRLWSMDDQGFGRAVYRLELGGHVYSLVAFTTALADEDRSDRVIAEAWDASFALFDGDPEDADLDRLQANLPKQEAGRYTERELVISRSNKSVRLFSHVADALAQGRQPDIDMVDSIGYLMRTTAVYGNGKFGIADRFVFADRPGLQGPFAAEMLTVWLIRTFTHDLVEHVAQMRGGGQAVRLDPAIKRHLGIGNSTGLGMAPFLVYHPELIHNWLHARETALARVRSLREMDAETGTRLRDLFNRARDHVEHWQVPDAQQAERLVTLRSELAEAVRSAPLDLAGPYPIKALMEWSDDQSLECQELIRALCLEPFGAIIDELTDEMAFSGGTYFDPGMTLSALSDILDEHYQWCAHVDFDDRIASQKFWYVSEAKLEPRLGDRYAEDGADREQPLDVARQVQDLRAAIAGFESPSDKICDLLALHPVHRNIVRRVQSSARRPFAEIRDNLIDQSMRPIDLLRCKLAFFGAVKFDPKSDLWTRITLFQGAPMCDELQARGDDWWLSTRPEAV